MALVAKNPLADAGDIRDPDSIPGSGRSSAEGKGHPLQYFCLENPIDKGASLMGSQREESMGSQNKVSGFS